MFHQGTLQSGITLAIQEQKLVACFVRDDGATSNEWEEEWLKSGWLSNLLAQKAVVLRLEAGSTEAGFLAAFSDISSVPTFVVIQNGQLQVQLKSDATKEDFINSIRRVLGANPIPGSSAASSSLPHTSTPEPSDNPTNAEAEDDLYGPSEPSIPTPSAPVPAPTPSSTKAKGKQRAPEPNPTAPSASASKAQQEARDALRKKKRDDAEELARIKARIEADKAARKVEASLRKAEREKEKNRNATQTSHATTSTPSSSPPATATAIKSSSSRGSNSATVALNVRLFDGRTIRSTFPRTATLQSTVRSWIDAEFGKMAQDDENISGGGGHNNKLPPYFFRHILAPAPSRELSAGDESVELGEIDLAPSATLVLVPVKGYTDAYSGGAGGVGGITGAATGIVGGAFGLLSSTVGLVGSTIGSVMGFGAQQEGGAGSSNGAGGRTVGSRPTTQEPTHDTVLDQLHPQPQPPSAGNGNGTGTTMRVRTLADQRAREPQQFYNGNQLSTEPRPEDNDKRD